MKLEEDYRQETSRAYKTEKPLITHQSQPSESLSLARVLSLQLARTSYICWDAWIQSEKGTKRKPCPWCILLTGGSALDIKGLAAVVQLSYFCDLDYQQVICYMCPWPIIDIQVNQAKPANLNLFHTEPQIFGIVPWIESNTEVDDSIWPRRFLHRHICPLKAFSD